MSDISVQPVNVAKKNYAAKGAKIGAGIYAGAVIGSNAGALALLGKDKYISSMKNGIEILGGKGKYATTATIILAGYTLIGAGIGKLVEVIKSKKEN